MANQTGTIFFLRNDPNNASNPSIPANNNNQGINKDTVSLGAELSTSMLVTGSSPYFSFTTPYAALAIDPSAQSYFFVDQGSVTPKPSGGIASSLSRPSIRTGSTTTGAVNANFLYTGPAYASGSYDYGSITDIAVDQANRRLYFTQAYVTGVVDTNTARYGKPDTANSGLFYISETGGTAVRVSAAGALSSPNVVAIDLADNIAFVADVTGTGLDGGQYLGANTPVNRLTAVNLTTGAVQVLFSETFHPDGAYGSDYYGGNVIDGLAVDAATHTLYYTTNNIYNNLATDAYSDTQDGVYKVSFSVSGGSVTLGATTTLYSGANAFDPSRIEIDTQNGVFYVVGNTQKYDAVLGGTGPYSEGIYSGSLTANNATALTRVTPASETLGTTTGDASDPHGEYFGTANQNPYFADSASIGFDAVPLVTAGATITYVSGAAATAADATLATSSATSVNYISASVAISGFKTGDVLAATTTGTSITASYNGTTYILSLSGTDTTAHYRQVLDSVTYRNSTSDPTGAGTSITRTLTWSVNDGINTGSATSTVNIATAPAANAGSPSVTFTGGGAAVAVDTVLTVIDYTSTNLAGATISISSGLLSGDTLGFTTQNGIAGSYNAGTGVLTLSGTATVANYQAAVRSVTFGFSPANGNPTAGNDTSRTLTYTLTDGALTSTAVTSTITVVHAPPTISPGASTAVTFTRGSGTAVVVDATATLTTPDSSGTIASATVSITSGFVSGDTLAATAGNGITASYNAATGVLSLSGSATTGQYQALIDGITFTTGNATATGIRTLSFVVNDGTANSTAATSTVNVVVPTPTLGGATANQAFTDKTTIMPFSTITLTDGAAQTEAATLTVKAGATASDANGVLSGTGLSKTGTGTYTLNASTPSALQALLDGLVFTPTANQVAPGGTVTTGFTIAVTDGGGGTTTNSTPSVIATSINDAPTITGTAAGQATTDLVPVQPFSGVTIGDVDVGALPTITITLKSAGAATDANGLLSGAGLTKTGVGTYSLAAANPATLTSGIRALTFTPTKDQVPIGQVVTTTFTVLAADQSTAASDSATSVQATDVPCYCRGTMILTARGEIAVEDLRETDHAFSVLSLSFVPVLWVGRRKVQVRTQAQAPIRIEAGAFGPGQPRGDLLVSPNHALYADGVLVPAFNLLNGTTVRRERVSATEYFHIEVPGHDVLLANGMAAESWLDCGNRGAFDNAAVQVLRGDVTDPVSTDHPGYCRACVSPEELISLRQRMFRQAVAAGYHVTGDADLHVLVDGVRVDPAWEGAVAHFELPAHSGQARLVSRALRPSDRAPGSEDHRALGVAVQAIWLDGAAVELAGVAGEGWCDIEREAGRPWRWTDGAAVLPAGVVQVRIGLREPGTYLARPDSPGPARMVA